VKFVLTNLINVNYFYALLILYIKLIADFRIQISNLLKNIKEFF